MLESWDGIAKEEAAKNPFFAKVYESQRAYASQVVVAAHHRPALQLHRRLLLAGEEVAAARARPPGAGRSGPAGQDPAAAGAGRRPAATAAGRRARAPRAGRASRVSQTKMFQTIALPAIRAIDRFTGKFVYLVTLLLAPMILANVVEVFMRYVLARRPSGRRT